ncbi:MAG TPA: ROK family protein [Rhizomicrobium sp.]|nr:ROK family protein [Rhizomicrobium sp.]
MRLGVDLGGSKIEIVALDKSGSERLRRRIDTPRDSYDAMVRAICDLVTAAERELGETGTLGVAIPGAISPLTGLVKNANTTKLIGHPLDRDLAKALGRAVRVANDANCFALSEATDGAAAGREIVFGVIAGTGVGGGVCVGGRVLAGAHAIAGEWGHNPLPRPSVAEVESAPQCYCGMKGCIESWCSGPALARQFGTLTGRETSAAEIARQAARGQSDARAIIDAFLDRFARALSTLVNILDPDAIVLGGGLSNMDILYTELPARVERYAFSPQGPTVILRNRHGDSSGVRGAAWLWPQ